MDETMTLDRLKELYQPPQKEFVLTDVPKMQFLMIDGEGDPAGEAFARAVKWLWTAAHPIRLAVKERMGKRFVEPPMECLFWADDMADFVAGNRDKWKWRVMIVTLDWVREEMYADALVKASGKLGDAPESLRLETYEEGLSAQIMHVGPYEALAPVAFRMHQEFLPEKNLVPHGPHHEIYLNDPNRTAPEKRRTVLRQPVRPAA